MANGTECLAVAELRGLDAGREALLAIAGKAKLREYHFYWAARAELELRAGHAVPAREHYAKAMKCRKANTHSFCAAAIWGCSPQPSPLIRRLYSPRTPPPRQHTVRYAGVLAAAAKWRAAVVPQPSFDAEPVPPSLAPAASPPSPPTHRSKYRPFVELLRRTFAIDLETCDHCGGRTKVIALVRDPDGVARFLRHLGEPTEPPPLSPRSRAALFPESRFSSPARRSGRALRVRTRAAACRSLAGCQRPQYVRPAIEVRQLTTIYACVTIAGRPDANQAYVERHAKPRK